MADLLLSRRRHRVAKRETLPALTASASIVVPHRLLRTNNLPWQDEAWAFFRTLGAFKYAMLWHSQTMSRVRLTAARTIPGGQEPELLTDAANPYVQLVNTFFNGTVGQSQYMKAMDVQLNVPGEAYCYMYDDEDGVRCYDVKSITEMRPTTGKAIVDGRVKTVQLWEVEVEAGAWRKLPAETHVWKQWQPDQEKSYLPDSPAQAALPIMRIINMMERRIISQAVSRLASNGLLLYPQEVTFPSKPGYEKELDPFTAEWLDIAGKTIENPGSALAAIPMPVKVPREYIKDFTHMDFANTYDEKVMEILQSFYDKLGVAMNMPKEVVSGMGNANHWNVWGLDEQGIEVHIKPGAEMIVAGATQGFFHPACKAAGLPITEADGSTYVMWYDTHQLDVPPDRSAAADSAADRLMIKPESYRREKGFSEEDAPDKTELREMILLKIAADPAQAVTVVEELTGSPVAGATAGPGSEEAPASEPAPSTGPPDRSTSRGGPGVRGAS